MNQIPADPTVADLPHLLDRAEAEVEYALEKLKLATEVLSRTRSLMARMRGRRHRSVSWALGVGFYTDEDIEAMQEGKTTGPLVGPAT